MVAAEKLSIGQTEPHYGPALDLEADLYIEPSPLKALDGITGINQKLDLVLCPFYSAVNMITGSELHTGGISLFGDFDSRIIDHVVKGDLRSHGTAVLYPYFSRRTWRVNNKREPQIRLKPRNDMNKRCVEVRSNHSNLQQAWINLSDRQTQFSRRWHLLYTHPQAKKPIHIAISDSTNPQLAETSVINARIIGANTDHENYRIKMKKLIESDPEFYTRLLNAWWHVISQRPNNDEHTALSVWKEYVLSDQQQIKVLDIQFIRISLLDLLTG